MKTARKIDNKVIGLARASTYRQNVSPETQLSLIAAYCDHNGLELVDSREALESGAKVERDSVLWALEEISAGRASGVIVTRLDRLARNLLELLKIVNRLNELGARLICTEQKIDTSTPEGRLFFHMMGALSEFERELIGERILEGKAAARAAGKFGGGPHKPFGFNVDEDGYLVHNEEEQEICDLVVEWRDDLKCSFQKIADHLTKTTGKKFHRNSVVRIYDKKKGKV